MTQFDEPLIRIGLSKSHLDVVVTHYHRREIGMYNVFKGLLPLDVQSLWFCGQHANAKQAEQ